MCEVLDVSYNMFRSEVICCNLKVQPKLNRSYSCLDLTFIRTRYSYHFFGFLLLFLCESGVGFFLVKMYMKSNRRELLVLNDRYNVLLQQCKLIVILSYTVFSLEYLFLFFFFRYG